MEHTRHIVRQEQRFDWSRALPTVTDTRQYQDVLSDVDSADAALPSNSLPSSDRELRVNDLSILEADETLPIPMSCDMDPTRRFTMLDAANAPFGLTERDAMVDIGITPGEMDGVEARTISARWAAVKMERKKRERQDKARLKRTIRQVRRSPLLQDTCCTPPAAD